MVTFWCLFTSKWIVALHACTDETISIHTIHIHSVGKINPQVLLALGVCNFQNTLQVVVGELSGIHQDTHWAPAVHTFNVEGLCAFLDVCVLLYEGQEANQG